MEIIHAHKLETVQSVKDFIFAGNATFTLRNPNSGNHLTFKVSAPKKQDPKRPVYFVNLMTGKDNEKSYSFLGTLFGQFNYQHSKKSILNVHDKKVEVFARFINLVENNILPSQVEIWHEGSCGRCGRKLTNPASILSGIGPECAHKRWVAANKQLKLTINS